MAFKGWKKAKIKTESGVVEASAPLIVSASRSTDIPAFHTSWLLERLKRGYACRINPFNGKPDYISFCNTRLIVFWSKDPSPLFPVLDELDKMGIRCLIQMTLNDYEKESYEKFVPPLSERIRTFEKLSGRVGKSRVMWRFDPLILSDQISARILCDKIGRIGDEIHGFTEQLTLSFLALYTKVDRNLRNAGVNIHGFDKDSISIIGDYLKVKKQHWGIDIFSCAEKQDLSRFEIEHGSCIDPELIARLFDDDPEISEFLGTGESNLFDRVPLINKKLKDPGQRELCNCIVSKDIGRYNTCPHLCIYCYANRTPEKILKWYKSRQISGDSM